MYLLSKYRYTFQIYTQLAYVRLVLAKKIGDLPSESLSQKIVCLFLKSYKHDTNNKALNDVLNVNAQATLLSFVPILLPLEQTNTDSTSPRDVSFFIRLYVRTAKYFKPLSPT